MLRLCYDCVRVVFAEYEILRYLHGGKLWEIFENSYVAIAKEGHRYGLLMSNLDGILFDKGYHPSYNGLWDDLCKTGTVTACYMQLWEKALDYEINNDDFDYWVSRLGMKTK